MPLDHFVSQVHLRRFNSPELGDRFHAIRKRDLRYFTPNSKSVCRIEGGSSNPYLSEERSIEEFLRQVEPNYNRAVERIIDDEIDPETIYTIAGFVAYVLACSPAAMRQHSTWLALYVKQFATEMDKRGIVPPAPEELENRRLSDLLDDGTVRVEIDPKYPQSMGIAQIVQQTHIFGNAPWHILRNDNKDAPFFTSDFPIATVRQNGRTATRIVPLCPTLGVAITPNAETVRSPIDLTFKGFKRTSQILRRHDAVNINRQIVRAAESEVYFSNYMRWVDRFVRDNANYRTEIAASTRRDSGRPYIHAPTEIRPYNWPKAEIESDT